MMAHVDTTQPQLNVVGPRVNPSDLLSYSWSGPRMGQTYHSSLLPLSQLLSETPAWSHPSAEGLLQGC